MPGLAVDARAHPRLAGDHRLVRTDQLSHADLFWAEEAAALAALALVFLLRPGRRGGRQGPDQPV